MIKKLKIGVNGRFFCQPYFGIGRYCLNIFPEMARLYPELEFVIAIPEKLPEEVDKMTRYQDNLKFEIIKENWGLKKLHAGFSKAHWEKKLLGDFFREKKVDLIHLPYPSLYQKKNRAKVLVTVHDAIPWVDMAYARRTWLSGFYNKATLEACRRADYLVTVSKESGREILGLGGFEKDQLRVVYNACEFEAEETINEEGRAKLLKNLGVENGGFLFYMGGYDKRKNVARLVKIFLREIAPNCGLKLVLGGSPMLKNSLIDEISMEGDEWTESVVRTGFLSNSDLAVLYNSAWAYFSITRSEGFNLPLLEALTMGCPALVSDLSVHEEVAGDTPFYLNLSKANTEIGKAILALQKDATRYNDLKAKTEAFAKTSKKKFSWEKSAQELAVIYQQLTT